MESLWRDLVYVLVGSPILGAFIYFLVNWGGMRSDVKWIKERLKEQKESMDKVETRLKNLEDRGRS